MTTQQHRRVPVTLERLIEHLLNAEDAATLNDRLVSYLAQFEVQAIVGHTLPFGSAPIHNRWAPMISTFPQDLQTYYRDHKCADEDPYVEAAILLGRPVQFSALRTQVALTPTHQRLNDKLTQHKLLDGLGLIVFARPGIAAYFGLGLPTTDAIPLKVQHLIQAACQQYFMRYHQLTSNTQQARLTQRERQILIGITNGKSNAVIAAQLGISEHTVGTYVRRCYEKIGANSRLEAAVKFMGASLLAAQFTQADSDEAAS
jgi:DNA-binding CsgD family transcriptional regulator